MNNIEGNSSQSFKNLKDEEILEKSLENPRFFEYLVDKYKDSFLRTVTRILNDQEEARDVCQDAFLKIYVHAKKFKKQTGIEFKSWCFKILLNCAFSRYRKLKRSFGDASYEDQYLYAASTRDSVFENKECKEEIESVLKRMPEELGSLLADHYLEDKPYVDIAADRGLSLNAVKMKLFRARRVFKKSLAEIS